jgi:hypothetical protein
VCALQFQVPDDGQLMQRWGDSSRMNVLWTFMGTSTPYQVFTGAAETLGAALLLFRRTTTLGALLLVAVMSNVVMLNLCYDVAVKLDSAHLLAMCVVLLLPDAGRLVDMFVRHRAIPAPPPAAVIARRSWRIARWGIKGVAIGLTLASITVWTVSAYQRRRAPAMAHHWAVGNWHVATFERDGRELADGDGARWERVRINAYGDGLYVRWWFARGMGAFYKVTFDDTAQVVKLAVEDDDGTVAKTGPLAFTFEHDPRDAARLTLQGQVGADTLRVVLVHDDTSHMILRTHGFRWVSDAQFDP